MPSHFRYSLLGARFTRSCDVIDYVTNRFATGRLLLVVHWNLSPIFGRFKIFASTYIWVTILTFWGHTMLSVMWDNGPQTFCGHDPDLFTSRDVIGHVTNRFPMAICYWLSTDTEALSLNIFEIFDPKVPCAHTQTHAASDFIFCPMHCIALDRQQTRFNTYLQKTVKYTFREHRIRATKKNKFVCIGYEDSH